MFHRRLPGVITGAASEGGRDPFNLLQQLVDASRWSNTQSKLVNIQILHPSQTSTDRMTILMVTTSTPIVALMKFRAITGSQALTAIDFGLLITDRKLTLGSAVFDLLMKQTRWKRWNNRFWSRGKVHARVDHNHRWFLNRGWTRDKQVGKPGGKMKHGGKNEV